MNDTEKIIRLGKTLPKGAKKKIAERTGLTHQTVVKFFKTGKAYPENALKMIEEAMVFYNQQQEVIEAQNKLLKLLK